MCGKISIHAPARGATRDDGMLTYCSTFQSTLPRGERRRVPIWSIILHGFQSTLPRGERLKYPPQRVPTHRISIHAPARGATRRSIGGRAAGEYFNPRSREGSDETYKTRTQTGTISIHAPARGATVPLLALRDDRTISIHAPARGATPSR